MFCFARRSSAGGNAERSYSSIFCSKKVRASFSNCDSTIQIQDEKFIRRSGNPIFPTRDIIVLMNEMLGKTTQECAKFVVGQHREIAGIIVRPYVYIPNQRSIGEEKILITREHFLNSFDANEMLQGRPEGTNITLDSTIKLDDDTNGYWPLLDLAMNKSDDNLRMAIDRTETQMSEFTGRVFLLETNRSYHLMGTKILPNENLWFDFLGKSLVSNIVIKTPDDQPNIHIPYVDYRYIGYSILRRSSGLRLTTSGKKTFEPRVVAITDIE